MLAPLYAWFREGLDARYLLEAKALLAEVGCISSSGGVSTPPRVRWSGRS